MKKWIVLILASIPLWVSAQHEETVDVHHTEKMGKKLSAEERKELVFLTKVKGVERVTGLDFTNVRDNRKFRRALRRGTGVNRFVQDVYPHIQVWVSAKAPANPDNQFIQNRNNPRFWSCNMIVTVRYKKLKDAPEEPDRTYGIVAGIMHDFNEVSIEAENDGWNSVSWDSHPGSILYGGMSLPTGEKFQTLVAFAFKDQLQISTQEGTVTTDLYGGKVTIGTYQSGINPNIGLFYLQGGNDYGAIALNGATLGLDLMETDWKVGLEAGGYWFNTNMDVEGYQPRYTDLIELQDKSWRIIFGINLKLYF